MRELSQMDKKQILRDLTNNQRNPGKLEQIWLDFYRKIAKENTPDQLSIIKDLIEGVRNDTFVSRFMIVQALKTRRQQLTADQRDFLVDIGMVVWGVGASNPELNKGNLDQVLTALQVRNEQEQRAARKPPTALEQQWLDLNRPASTTTQGNTAAAKSSLWERIKAFFANIVNTIRSWFTAKEQEPLITNNEVERNIHDPLITKVNPMTDDDLRLNEDFDAQNVAAVKPKEEGGRLSKLLKETKNMVTAAKEHQKSAEAELRESQKQKASVLSKVKNVFKKGRTTNDT